VNWDECEAIKIFYNTWISTKIAYVNLIQDIAVKNKNINVDKVTEALANSNRSILGKKYMRAGMGDGGACHPRDNIALRWLARELDIGYDFFGNIMDTRERQAENMAKEILKHGTNIWFSSDSYKPNTNLLDGSYSLLVQHFVKQHGGQIVQGIDNKVEVIVRVHETDVFSTDETTVIFDPWRTYPPGKNVVYYGRPR
jgi:UDPglucose 6-dehydrogenase